MLFGVDQELPLQLSALPLLSTAMHKVAEGQEIELIELVVGDVSTRLGELHPLVVETAVCAWELVGEFVAADALGESPYPITVPTAVRRAKSKTATLLRKFPEFLPTDLLVLGNLVKFLKTNKPPCNQLFEVRRIGPHPNPNSVRRRDSSHHSQYQPSFRYKKCRPLGVSRLVYLKIFRRTCLFKC